MLRPRTRRFVVGIVLFAAAPAVLAQMPPVEAPRPRTGESRQSVSPYGTATSGKARPLLAVQQGNRWGYADLDGRLVIPPRFELAYDYSEGLARVRSQGVDLFLGESGKAAFVLDNAQAIGDFSEGLAPVRVDGKIGYVDRNGTFVIMPQFDEAYAFASGVARVAVGGKTGVIDTTGHWVLSSDGATAHAPVPYQDFSEGLAPFGSIERCGYVTNRGEVAIEANFASCRHFSEGLAAIQRADGAAAFIDRNGKEVFGGFGDALAFADGLAPAATAETDGTLRWGFVDHEGRWVIPARYEEVHIFQEGLAAVRQNGRFGYVDRSGRVVIPARYIGAGPFRRGVARVATISGALDTVIDRRGTPIWPR